MILVTRGKTKTIPSAKQRYSCIDSQQTHADHRYPIQIPQVAICETTIARSPGLPFSSCCLTHVHVVPQLSSAVLGVLEALELDGENRRQAPHVHLLRGVAELLAAGAVALTKRVGGGRLKSMGEKSNEVVWGQPSL